MIPTMSVLVCVWALPSFLMTSQFSGYTALHDIVNISNVFLWFADVTSLLLMRCRDYGWAKWQMPNNKQKTDTKARRKWRKFIFKCKHSNKWTVFFSVAVEISYFFGQRLWLNVDICVRLCERWQPTGWPLGHACFGAHADFLPSSLSIQTGWSVNEEVPADPDYSGLE